MSGGLERVVDFFISILDLFKFWIVCPQYEGGVILRLGKHTRNLKTGLNFYWPLGFYDALTTEINLRTTFLITQSLMTKDNVRILITGMFRWRVKHPDKFLLNAEDSNEAISDSTYGVIGKFVPLSTWNEVNTADFREKVYEETRRRGFIYGIEILELQFVDLTDSKTLRIVGIGSNEDN